MRSICLIALASAALLPATTAARSGSTAHVLAMAPCSSLERHQFDFWLGNWRVVDASGAFQGTNDVTSEFAGCALQEHWKGVEGDRGSSFNSYLPGRKEWQQTWVDGHGLTLQLYGGRKGVSMVLSGTRLTKTGPVIDRITWTPLPDGRVRQHWQESKRGASGWHEIFDGYYSRIAR